MKNNYSRLKWVALIIVGGILLFLAKSATAANLRSPLLLQQEVSGKVIDHNGVPIPGVTIRLKGTSRGTLTNLDGEYSITASENAILVFSFIGYKTHEEQINNQTVINVQLEEDIASLGEVQINAGYYNTTRRESTGNISRVTAEEIELQPVVNPIQALAGRMAGVEIKPGGNFPGQASTIRIRGQNSLREAGNFPFYIIDGVPVNSTPIDSYSNLGAVGIDPLNTLNVSNIESIEVLKDADATAIYGSRGANGVVLITTKKGREGKTKLQTHVYTGASRVPNRLDLLNTVDYIQIRQKAFENDGVEPTENNAYDLIVWDQNRYTNWQDFFLGGTSQVTNVNLNASGGTENTTYRLSSSYSKQGTIYLGNYDYKKITAGFNLNHTSENKELNFDLSVNYGIDVNNLVGNIDLSYYGFNLPPNAPKVFNEDGSLHWQEWDKVGLNNPLAGFFNSSKTEVNNLISNFGISYKLLKGLKIKINGGYTQLQSKELVKMPLRSYSPSSWDTKDNQSSHLNSSRTSWIIEPQLTYNIKILEGEIDALVGGTFQEAENTSEGLQGVGYVSESLIGNLSATERIINPANVNTQYRYNAIFARLGFKWAQKYFFNLTGRRDGSSRFGPGNRLANFGAVGTAWIFSEEPFIKKSLSFLSFGKLRGSYGTTGNDQIGDYGYLDAYEATRGPSGLYPTQLANPNYSWEVNKKLEAAINLGFLKDRINFGLSWYRNRSSSQLVGYPLPSITGFSTIQANLPATVENTGWEVELSSLNVQSEVFGWRTSFNISLPNNELIAYPNLDQSSYANIYRVGQPLNIGLLYQYEGIDTETGFYKVTDVNEDGRFDYEDQNIVWDRGKEYFGGISNSLRYKNFSLQFLWQFVKQEGLLRMFETGALNNERSEVVQALEGADRFQVISQSIEASRAYTNVLNSTLPLVDASFLRLKTSSLSYSFPEVFLKTLGLNKGSLFLNGQNLITLTNYKGMDPELPNGGISFGSLRTITAGLQLQF
jgi:TonB-linked SusC/RagA family outer membrane protein